MDIRQIRLAKKFKLAVGEAGKLIEIGADSPVRVRKLDKDVLESMVGEEKAAKIQRAHK